jgi:hypothetical protein
VITETTVGEIARRLGQPLHRVEYVLRTRDIRPTSRAGNALVYAEPDIARIASELAEIEGRRLQRRSTKSSALKVPVDVGRSGTA